MSKNRMKFRRALYKLGKYAMFVFSVITCYNITTALLEARAEKQRTEKRKRIALLVFTVFAWTAAIGGGIALILKYIKHLKKGYLFDFFDTEAYDVIEPDEEAPAESLIRSDLYGSDDAADHEKLTTSNIPLDEEASEEML